MRMPVAKLRPSLLLMTIGLAATAAGAFDAGSERPMARANLGLPVFIDKPSYAALSASHAALSRQPGEAHAKLAALPLDGVKGETAAADASPETNKAPAPRSEQDVHSRAEELSRRFQGLDGGEHAEDLATKKKRDAWEAAALNAASEISRFAATSSSDLPQDKTQSSLGAPANLQIQMPALKAPNVKKAAAEPAPERKKSKEHRALPSNSNVVENKPPSPPVSSHVEPLKAGAIEPNSARAVAPLAAGLVAPAPKPAAPRAASRSWRTRVHQSEFGPFGWDENPG